MATKKKATKRKTAKKRTTKKKAAKRKEEQAQQLVHTHLQTDDVWEQCFR